MGWVCDHANLIQSKPQSSANHACRTEQKGGVGVAPSFTIVARDSCGNVVEVGGGALVPSLRVNFQPACNPPTRRVQVKTAIQPLASGRFKVSYASDVAGIYEVTVRATFGLGHKGPRGNKEYDVCTGGPLRVTVKSSQRRSVSVSSRGKPFAGTASRRNVGVVANNRAKLASSARTAQATSAASGTSFSRGGRIGHSRSPSAGIRSRALLK